MFLGKLDQKYNRFVEFLNTFENVDFLDYFFPKEDVNTTEILLELDNKFGRKDSKFLDLHLVFYLGNIQFFEIDLTILWLITRLILG